MYMRHIYNPLINWRQILLFVVADILTHTLLKDQAPVAKAIEHGSHVREIVESNPRSRPTDDLQILYLSLSSQMLCLNRIG